MPIKTNIHANNNRVALNGCSEIRLLGNQDGKFATVRSGHYYLLLGVISIMNLSRRKFRMKIQYNDLRFPV